MSVPELTKAEPFEQWKDRTMGTACLHCGDQIKRVPGGHGPVWVHSETGAVVCRSARSLAEETER